MKMSKIWVISEITVVGHTYINETEKANFQDIYDDFKYFSALSVNPRGFQMQQKETAD